MSKIVHAGDFFSPISISVMQGLYVRETVDCIVGKNLMSTPVLVALRAGVKY